nr:hypothetical protein [Tanacetum cinerariifolium]
LGWHLEEIHVTWAHLEKKRTRLQLFTKVDEEMCTVAGDGVRNLVTPSEHHSDGVKTFVTATDLKRLKKALKDSAKRGVGII